MTQKKSDQRHGMFILPLRDGSIPGWRLIHTREILSIVP